jgi:hypothetical protein
MAPRVDQMSRTHAGLLAWTSGGLILVDGKGNVYDGQDAGRRFQRAGQIGGQPAALASHGDELYVALHTNEVMRK